MTINIQKSNSFGEMSYSVGPASWRSSDSSNTLSPSTYSPNGTIINNYRGSDSLLPYFYLSQHNQNGATFDLHKEQKEEAKDLLFLKKHPDLNKEKNKNSKVMLAGGVTTIAAAFLTKGIEITKKAKNTKVNFDPLLLIGSVFLGLIAGVFTNSALKPNIRIQRLMEEEKNKQK